jgi:ribosomal protein S8
VVVEKVFLCNETMKKIIFLIFALSCSFFVLGQKSATNFDNPTIFKEFNKTKDSIKKQMVWKPDANSYKISESYTKQRLFEFLPGLNYLHHFLPFNTNNIKNLKITGRKSKTEKLTLNISFNKKGHITNCESISTNDSNINKSIHTFEYKDNLLFRFSIQSSYNEEVNKKTYNSCFYSKGKLIADNEYTKEFYKLKNDFLEYKGFYSDELNHKFIKQTVKNIDNKIIDDSDNYNIIFNEKNNFFPIKLTTKNGKKDLSITYSNPSVLNYDAVLDDVTMLKIEYLNKDVIKQVLIIDPDDITKHKKINQYKFDFNYEYYK